MAVICHALNTNLRPIVTCPRFGPTVIEFQELVFFTRTQQSSNYDSQYFGIHNSD